jgi:hypothetical protein
MIGGIHEKWLYLCQRLSGLHRLGPWSFKIKDGDPVVDASLYLDRIRKDVSTFTSLYGLHPTKVAELGK